MSDERTTLSDDEILTTTPGDTRLRQETDADGTDDADTDTTDSDTDDTDADTDDTDAS
jgi:hypothetical protein